MNILGFQIVTEYKYKFIKAKAETSFNFQCYPTREEKNSHVDEECRTVRTFLVWVLTSEEHQLFWAPD